MDELEQVAQDHGIPKIVPIAPGVYEFTCQCGQDTYQARTDDPLRNVRPFVCATCAERLPRCKHLPPGEWYCYTGWHWGLVGEELLSRRCPDAIAMHEVQTFANFERDRQPDAYDRASAYAEAVQHTGSLVLMGTQGTGKTHLAHAICARVREQQRDAVFVLAADLADMFRRIDCEHIVEDELERDHLVSCDMLAIDDLGHEHATTEFFATRLRQLVDWRRNKHNEPVWVISTNLTERKLRERYNNDESLVSRLFERAEVVTMTGKDYRRGR